MGVGCEVRLVNPNLAEEERIAAILSSLEDLSAITERLFSRIGRSVQEKGDFLRGLEGRAQRVADKVESLGKKPLRITSSSKYPGDDDKREQGGYSLLSTALQDDRDPDLDLGGILVPKRSRPPSRFFPPVKHPSDLLACFHVREPNILPLGKALGMKGLGPPPSQGQGQGHDLLIDPYLLFNTTQNPYLEYKLPGKSSPARVLPLKLPVSATAGSAGSRKEEPSPEEGGPGDDPGDEGDFYYSPSALEAPLLEVPDLPPGLHLDVEVLGGSMASLEEEEQDFFKTAATAKRKKKKKANPPPQEKPSAVSAAAITTTVSTTTAAGQGQGPPPPPPPPAPAPPKVTATTAAASTCKGGGADKPDPRSSLMEAIRAAGGAEKASLRSTQERKYEQKRNKKKMEEAVGEESSSSGGVDLMADLKASLLLRRKGISGIMDNLLSRVPHLTGNPPGDELEGAEGEDNDNSDWDSD